MNKIQIFDADLCEKLAESGIDKDCMECSCQVCIAQEPKVLTANDYQVAALRTANSEDPKDLILNGALGLCGESGELADIIKKHLFQGHDLDKIKAAKELGDICWYVAIEAKGLGFTLEEIMNMNIDKLIERYPEGFDKDKSINREV